ncbi:hypothetical protein HJC99_01590 [Candidatus Saccharibacteria bacterium]|nr:hypothetical protein [Candidatus Saccharibacteria bacterium]
MFFVYQKPELAWYFTKARAADPEDGRVVDKLTSIAAYV